MLNFVTAARDGATRCTGGGARARATCDERPLDRDARTATELRGGDTAGARATYNLELNSELRRSQAQSHAHGTEPAPRTPHVAATLVLGHNAGVKARLLRFVSALVGREIGREVHLVRGRSPQCSGSIQLRYG